MIAKENVGAIKKKHDDTKNGKMQQKSIYTGEVVKLTGVTF